MFTACKRSCRKVMFLQVSVILFTGGGEWYPSMHCRSPGLHPRGSCRVWPGGGLQAHTQGGSCGVWPVGGSPGPHPGGEVERSGLGGLQVHTQGEVEGSGLGESPGPHSGATAARGTHPTRMHSCLNCFSKL